jgi:hypothetical protein
VFEVLNRRFFAGELFRVSPGAFRFAMLVLSGIE